MSVKPIEAKIEALITDDLSGMGYELVRVHLMSGGSYLTLQVMAERADRKPMTVDDCVKISRAVSDKLDADDTMADRYTLEVSSPGIDRPLVRLKDFERFTGHVARVELEMPLEGPEGGQKRFQGSIVRITGREPDAEIELRTQSGEVRVPVKGIARARLVPESTLSRADTKH
ncbi:MAG: ribosome maturation factor RimP [Alphaproteobacteria bacterium]|nr:ribosome maturation factor RimP [Alphaproteobacteria bacterium]